MYLAAIADSQPQPPTMHGQVQTAFQSLTNAFFFVTVMHCLFEPAFLDFKVKLVTGLLLITINNGVLLFLLLHLKPF